jgi:hypothetical protein
MILRSIKMMTKVTEDQLNKMDSILRKQWELQKPLVFAIYKGVSGKYGCFQFKLANAYDNPNRPERIDGGVFIEAAPAVGSNKYDWENKIVFALSVSDIGKILNDGLRGGEVSIFHDPGAKSDKANITKKSLKITKGQKGGYFWSLREETAGREKTVSIPVSNDEATVIAELLKVAIPKILGWS